jgi:DNA-binding NtrC family response regulator
MIDFITCDSALNEQSARLTNTAAAEAFILCGPTGSGHHAFARQVWKNSSPQRRPFIFANCANLKGLRDLQRHFVRAACGDLFLQQIDLLDSGLYESLRYFTCSDPSVRIIASWEQQNDDELPALLRELFPTRILLRRLKERQGEIPYILNHVAGSYGLEDFPPGEIAYIVQHTLSLRYSQFIACIQRMAELALHQGKVRIDATNVHEVVAGSKKMLSYAQLLQHSNFCTLHAESKFRGIKETLLLLEAAIIARTLNETFHCLAHSARILQLPVNTLSSRQKVLAPQIEIFNRLLAN